MRRRNHRNSGLSWCRSSCVTSLSSGERRWLSEVLKILYKAALRARSTESLRVVEVVGETNGYTSRRTGTVIGWVANSGHAMAD